MEESPKKDRQLDNLEDYEIYDDDDEEAEFKAPDKNETSEAIFQKYAKGQLEPVIKEEEEENQSQPPQKRKVLRIKNLDTGEEIQIEDEDMEEQFTKKMTQGLNFIGNSNANWGDFWQNVSKNNQKLINFCEQGLYEQANELLSKGDNNYPVEVNCKGLDDWTPLHFACYEGSDDLVELLCDYGAYINAITSFGRNCVHISTLRGQLNVIKMLKDKEINLDAADYDGNTGFHFAAEGGHKEIVQYLLEQKCKIIKNKEGKTAIHDSCDETIKKIFYNAGFTQNGQYEQFQGQKTNDRTNKVERALIPSGTLSTEDFVFHKLLGKGSFGQVFLVHKKDEEKKLYAMKILSKDKVLTKNLKRYAITQRNVMSVLNHPFMVKLHFAFQSSTKLFLVMDYYPGGDLGKLITRKRSVPEDQARKYISELILAFEALHKNMIVFRDLKPDNVVLDIEGHVRLTDFGLSKEGIYNNTTQSFCGSVAYLAPEILSKQGHSRTVDWYLLGLLLYELIVGLPPYYNNKKQVLFDNIKRGPLKIPKTMSSEAKDIIKKLLCRDPKKRLGNLRDGEELKEHDFFKGVNWQDVFNRKLEMPPIEEPKINLNETMKVSFDTSEGGKRIEGWTFINNLN